MKNGVRESLHIKCKKEEREFVSEEEESTFWEKKLLGTTSAKSLLNTMYFYNGKIFGLRGGEYSHWPCMTPCDTEDSQCKEHVFNPP